MLAKGPRSHRLVVYRMAGAYVSSKRTRKQRPHPPYQHRRFCHERSGSPLQHGKGHR